MLWEVCGGDVCVRGGVLCEEWSAVGRCGERCV